MSASIEMNGMEVNIRDSNMSKEERDNFEREGFTTQKTYIKSIAYLTLIIPNGWILSAPLNRN